MAFQYPGFKKEKPEESNLCKVSTVLSQEKHNELLKTLKKTKLESSDALDDLIWGYDVLKREFFKLPVPQKVPKDEMMLSTEEPIEEYKKRMEEKIESMYKINEQGNICKA